LIEDDFVVILIIIIVIAFAYLLWSGCYGSCHSLRLVEFM